MPIKKREGQQLLIRFPVGSDLRTRLEEVAKASGRTTTAEVIHRLEQSLEGEKGLEADVETLRAEVRMLSSRVMKLESQS